MSCESFNLSKAILKYIYNSLFEKAVERIYSSERLNFRNDHFSCSKKYPLMTVIYKGAWELSAGHISGAISRFEEHSFALSQCLRSFVQ